jgi:hypothetical protein
VHAAEDFALGIEDDGALRHLAELGEVIALGHLAIGADDDGDGDDAHERAADEGAQEDFFPPLPPRGRTMRTAAFGGREFFHEGGGGCLRRRGPLICSSAEGFLATVVFGIYDRGSDGISKILTDKGRGSGNVRRAAEPV